jgi:uncharacterized protein YjdB
MRLRNYPMSFKLFFFWSIVFSSSLFASELFAQNNILAFPGADGFAKYITGGRGGQIRKVTNLNDSGPGSFREAASFKGPSIIVFEVSGTIELKSNVTVPDNTTIAGQTAPGDGITFKNYRLTLIEKNNVIIRFIRFRLGDLTGREDNAIFVRDCSDIIFDHCSFSWGTDETATNFRNRNISFQWCIISEGLNNSVHSEGIHGFGAVWGGKNISYHHNLMAHFTQRCPFFDHPGLYNTQEQFDNFRGVVDFRNNVVYNWQDKAASGGAEGTINFINNYYKSGPATRSDDFILNPQNTGNGLIFDYGRFYVSGNILFGKPLVTLDNWKGVRLENPELTLKYLEDTKVFTPFPAEVYLNTDSAEEAYTKVLEHAGASFYRDPVDSRIIKETSTGTYTYKGSKTGILGIIDSQKDVGGWPVLKSLPAPKDTDRDGMPDVWEAENGLNPNLADHNGYKLSSSYTNIEVYINGLVKHISEPDAVVAPSTPQLESPLNNAVGIAKTTPLKWKSASNAQSYQIQVSKTQDFGTLVTNVENLTSLQYAVPNLEDNTQYYWRVRAKNNTGTSSWSSVWNFKTLQPLSVPEIPKPINPSNGSKDLPNTLLLEWSKVTGAQTYRVQVAKDATFSSMVYDIYNLTGQNIEVKNLEPGSSFAWRVRATNEAGSSNFSEAWTFSTQVNTTTEVISVTGVTLNPTKASIEISKSLQINATVLPSNASNKTVSWISSNPSIASVSPSGLVTGIKSGTALITASSQDGNFTSTSEITVATNVPMGISGFTLVNADSDSDIGSISDGNHLDINEIEGLNLNIRVNTNPGLVGSVALSLTGPVNANITENVAPYALFGDNRGNYNGKLLQAGEYTLEAVPYSEPNLGGTKGNPMTVKFTIGEKISAPASPKLSSPLDNSTGLSTTLKLAWNAVANADSYGIEVSKNPDFSSLVINNNSLKTNEFTVSGLQEDTTYFWRVRATNSSGSSPYSTVWTFRTVKPIMVPAVPTLLSPSNGAKDLSLSPSLQWNAVTGAKTYRVQVSKESNFATLFLDNTSVTTNSLQVNNLEEGLTYYWRVSSTNESGNSSFSSGWNFTTKPPTNEVIPVSGISINPTKADLEVSKTLQLTAAILPSNADNKTVSFTSSNPGIASVSPSGLVTGIKSGAALITATSEDGNFTAISEITVSSPEALGIAQFTLVNADSDTDILELTNGSILDINQVLGLNLNIRVNTNPETVGSVAISISGPISATITENVAPYALFGDSNGNYNGRILSEGSYSLEAVPYSEPNFGGIKGTPLSIQFSIAEKILAPAIPTLSSPADNTTGLETSINLTWNPVPNAETYTIELSKNPDFSSLVVNNNSLKTNEFTVSGLQEETSYYWRVKATNSAGSSPYSSVWTLRTVKPIVVPAVPTLLSPSNGAKDLSLSPSLQWNAVTGAKTYRIQISKESSFGTILIDNATLTGNTFQANNLEEGVAYYWRVNAANEAGNSIFSSAWSFQTKISLKAPLTPTLINPSDKSTGLATTLKLSWSAVANAETYTIELSKNPDFSSLVVNNNSLKTNEFTVSGLQEDTSYYWRVKASNVAGSSPYSTVWTFKTIKPLLTPEVPTLLSPLDGAKDVSTTTSLQWNAVTSAKTYRIQISKESSFGTILIDNATLTGNTFQVNSLEEGVTYYWRVNAANEAGISNFSSGWSFRTKISIIAPVAPTLINPSDKSTGLATTLKLSWSTVTGAEGYTLELSKNADFSSLINSNSGLTANEFVLSGLEEGSQYYWRVKASNSAGSSPYSQVWSFTTKEKINPPASPTLLGPNHESVSLTGKITFTWTKSEGSMSYGIQISKSQDFTVKQVDITGIQTESIDISDLENGVTYYWRVYASNEGGNSGFSEIWKFETLALPDIPVLLSPSNGKKDLGLNSTLLWESTLGAVTYRLQVSKTKDFSQNLIDQSNISETSFTLENLEEGIIYYWRVRASNAAGNSAFSSTWEFTTEKPLKAPTAPILLSPSSGTLMNFEEVVLGWKTVIDAERYQVQVSKYSNFSQAIVFDNNTVSTDQVPVDGLEPNEVYFWRVRAINIVGTSPYSSVWNFITLPLPDLDSPLLVSPTKGAEVDTASVEFEWETVTDAEFYELQLALDSTFTNQVMRFSQIVETKFRVDSLEIGKSYYWKVIANGKRPSSESETWKFTIKEDGDLIKANISPVTIKTYPNPFKDKITLEFSRPIEGEVTISIFDNKGISVFENKVSDLMESITLEVPPGLPKGIYLIRIQGFGIFEGKRVVKN